MNRETKIQTLAFFTYLVLAVVFLTVAISRIRAEADLAGAVSAVIAALSFFCAVRLTH